MMRKYFLIITIPLFCFSCAVSMTNRLLEKNGIYDEEVKYNTIDNNLGKTIVFIKNKHIAPDNYYSNLKSFIDSTQNDHYFVMFEGINMECVSDQDFRKYRKMFPVPINLNDFKSKKSEYTKVLDSIVSKIPNFQYKKILIDQPSHQYLINNLGRSKNVDVNVKDILNAYENKFGEIELDSCDYIDTWTNNKCPKLIDKKKVDEVFINYRNDQIISELKNSPEKKIIILYGEEHFKDLKNKLER